jgi:large subunit ribosomal protein L25
MSGSAILLQAEERSVTGKQVKRLRKSGLVPAVVYEKGVPSDNVAVSYIPMVKTWNKAGKHHAITLSYGSKKRLTIIKDVTLDPIKGQISHIAFQAVKLNEKIETEVPVVLEGHAPATVAGLLVHVNIDHVVVSGFPNDIPDSIVVDVSSVTTPEDDIRASELVLPKNIELVTDADSVIVSVIVPRAEVEKVEETVDAANVPSDNGSAKTEE